MKGYVGGILFVCGAVLGAVGSAFYLRKEFRKIQAEDNAVKDMAIIELKRIVDEQEKKLDQEEKTKYQEAVGAILEASGYVSTEEGKDTAKSEKSPRTRYRASQSKLGAREGLVYSVDEKGRSEAPSEGPIDKPYVITPDDFYLDKKEFDKTTLIYYQTDGVISDEQGEVVEDANMIIGEDWKKALMKSPEDEVYIRNERLSSDFEIVSEMGKYSDAWG